MKKLIMMAIVAIVTLTGCQTEGDIITTTTVTQGDGGVYISNADGTVTYYDANGDSSTDSNVSNSVFNASYDRADCTAAGFFWCTLSNVCLNQRIGSGSCTQ